MPLVLLVLLLGTTTISLVWDGVCSERRGLAVVLRLVEAVAGTAWFVIERPAELALLSAGEMLLGIALVSALLAILVSRIADQSGRTLHAAQLLLVLALLALEFRG